MSSWSIEENMENWSIEDKPKPKPKFKRIDFIKNTAINIYSFFKKYFYIPSWSNKKKDDHIEDKEELLNSSINGSEIIEFYN
jgi:hypothetical protein